MSKWLQPLFKKPPVSASPGKCTNGSDFGQALTVYGLRKLLKQYPQDMLVCAEWEGCIAPMQERHFEINTERFPGTEILTAWVEDYYVGELAIGRKNDGRGCLMNGKEREEKNRLIDVLFDQIEQLDGNELAKAMAAVDLWNGAKTGEFIGGRPMVTSHMYKTAYETLKGMGLEVGGMLEPLDYERA